MTDIGTLAISMGLDIAELRKDSARAKKDIKDMSSAMERDINRVNKNFERMSDRFSKDISQLKRSVASLEQQMDKMAKSTERSFDRTNKAVKKSSSAFNGFVKTVRAAALGYATVLATMEITQFTSGILKQGVALDSLQRSYKAITGSAEESNRILNMLGKTANDLGLNLNAVEDSYRNILAASKNTVLEGQAIEKVFMSVVKASAVLGMSADDTAGTLRALSQMISKGNVQAEELRGQLGERLPGAFQMAAEAMGVSTQELNKMLEQGQVLASELLPKLADVLENRFGEAAKDAGDRAGASFERLSNSVIQLQRTLATSGILDLFVELADSISSLLNDSQDDIEEFMESLNFEDGIENVLALASAFGKLYKVITFGGGIGEFAGYVNALTDEFFTMLDGAKALAQGQITWDEFLGSGNEINAAVDRWKEGEKAVLAFRDAVTVMSEDGKTDVAELFKAFDKPKEAIQSLQNELNKLQKDIDKYIDVFGKQRRTPVFDESVAKANELRETILKLQGVLDYGFEVETLERLGNTFGYIQQKTNDAIKAQEEFQDIINASPFDVNMGEFGFDSKTRDAALKSYDNQKKLLDEFVNYSKSKYDEERENVNETFRQLYITYKDDAEKREQLRQSLSDQLLQIDEKEKQELAQKEKEYNDWVLKMKIKSFQNQEQATAEYHQRIIEAMNAVIAKEKEVYEWIKEIRVQNIKDAEKERQKATQQEIEAMNAVIAKEKEAYEWSVRLRGNELTKQFLAYIQEENQAIEWQKQIRIQAIKDTLTAQQEAYHEQIQAMNAVINTEKEEYAWLKEIKIQNIKESEKERVQSAIREIQAMNAQIAEEEKIYEWIKSIRVQNIKDAEQERIENTIREIEALNNQVKEEKKIYDWIKKIKIQNIKDAEQERIESIQREIEALNDQIAQEKSLYESLQNATKELKRDRLSDYQREVDIAKETYGNIIKAAKEKGFNTEKLEKELQLKLDKLWKEELERRQKVLDDRVKAEKAARQWILDAEIQNIWDAEKERQDSWQREIEAMNKQIAKEKKAYEKSRKDKIKAEKEAAEKIKKDWERVYDDMHKFAADTFYDIFDGQLDSFEDFADSMLDIFKRMLANMAAEVAMTNIFKPMMNQMAGSTLGNMLGLPSLAGGGGTTMFPSFSGMSNLPGMGWLGATIPGSTNLAMTTAGASQGMLYPGAISGPAPAGFGGATWGSALGAGALGSLGYTYLGGPLGLPQSGYSGITSGLGAAGMSAYGGSLAGLTGIGALGGPIGIGLGALAGGLLGGLFGGGSDPKPALGIQGGLSSDPGRRPTDFYDSRFFNWTVFEQDLSADAAIAIRDYFDNYFLQIDTAVNGALKETFKKYDAGAVNRGWVYTEGLDEGQIINGISNTIFKGILEGLKAESLGAGFEAFDVEFFESIKTEGQDLFQVYTGFYNVVSNTEGFIEDFTRRIDELGQTSVEAYQQIQLVSGVLAEMDMAIAQITGSAVIGQINALSDTWDAYIDVMRQAQATAEQLTDAESKRNLVIGAQITGLTATSVEQALMSGGDISDIVAQNIKSMMVSVFSENLMESALSDFNKQVGRAFAEGGADAAFAVYEAFDFGPIESEVNDFMVMFEQGVQSMTREAELMVAEILQGGLTASQMFEQWGIQNADAAALFAEITSDQVTRKELEKSVDAFSDLGLEGKDLTTVISYLTDAFVDSASRLNSALNDINTAKKTIPMAVGTTPSQSFESAFIEFLNTPSLDSIVNPDYRTESVFDEEAYKAMAVSIANELGYSASEAVQAKYFDESKYMQNKVAQLNQSGFEGKRWDLASTYAAFDLAGLSPQEHYLQYGKDEGLMPFEWTVSLLEKVVDELGITFRQHLDDVGTPTLGIALEDVMKEVREPIPDTGAISSEKAISEALDKIFQYKSSDFDILTQFQDFFDTLNSIDSQVLYDIYGDDAADMISNLSTQYANYQSALEQEEQELLSAKLSMENQLYTILEDQTALQGVINQQRQIELDTMDESLRPIQEHIWALQDEAESADRAEQALSNATSARDDAANAYLSALQSELSNLQSSFDSAKNIYVGFLQDAISSHQEELQILEGRMNDAKSNYLSALQSEASEQEALANSIGSAVDSIRDFRKSLSTGTDSPLNLEQRQAELMLQQTVLAGQAKAGDIDSVSELISISSEYLDVTKNLASNEFEYAREVSRTSNLMSDVESSLGVQKSAAERQAESLQNIYDSVSGTSRTAEGVLAAESAYYSAKSAFDRSSHKTEINHLQNIIDEVTMANKNAQTLAEAQAEYEAAKMALDENWYTDEIAMLEGLLGKTQSIEELMEAFINAQARYEAARIAAANAQATATQELADAQRVLVQVQGTTNTTALGIQPFATGGSFTVGGTGGIDSLSLPQMRVSPGEMVNISRPDVMSSMSEELRELRAEVRQLREENRAHAVAQIKSSQAIERNTDYLEAWDVNGLPAEETV